MVENIKIYSQKYKDVFGKEYIDLTDFSQVMNNRKEISKNLVPCTKSYYVIGILSFSSIQESYEKSNHKWLFQEIASLTESLKEPSIYQEVILDWVILIKVDFNNYYIELMNCDFSISNSYTFNTYNNPPVYTFNTYNPPGYTFYTSDSAKYVINRYIQTVLYIGGFHTLYVFKEIKIKVKSSFIYGLNSGGRYNLDYDRRYYAPSKYYKNQRKITLINNTETTHCDIVIDHRLIMFDTISGINEYRLIITGFKLESLFIDFGNRLLLGNTISIFKSSVSYSLFAGKSSVNLTLIYTKDFVMVYNISDIAEYYPVITESVSVYNQYIIKCKSNQLLTKYLNKYFFLI